MSIIKLLFFNSLSSGTFYYGAIYKFDIKIEIIEHRAMK